MRIPIENGAAAVAGDAAKAFRLVIAVENSYPTVPGPPSSKRQSCRAAFKVARSHRFGDFQVESTGEARPTIEGRALSELGIWRRIDCLPSRA